MLMGVKVVHEANRESATCMIIAFFSPKLLFPNPHIRYV